METVDLVGDPLLHAADIRGDHRPAEHPGFRDDQPEDLPPYRGHDAPVDAGHAVWLDDPVQVANTTARWLSHTPVAKRTEHREVFSEGTEV